MRLRSMKMDRSRTHGPFLICNAPEMLSTVSLSFYNTLYRESNKAREDTSWVRTFSRPASSIRLTGLTYMWLNERKWHHCWPLQFGRSQQKERVSEKWFSCDLFDVFWQLQLQAAIITWNDWIRRVLNRQVPSDLCTEVTACKRTGSYRSNHDQ